MTEAEKHNEYLYSFSYINNSEKLSLDEIDGLGVFCLTYYGKPFYWIKKKYAELEHKDKDRLYSS